MNYDLTNHERLALAAIRHHGRRGRGVHCDGVSDAIYRYLLYLDIRQFPPHQELREIAKTVTELYRLGFLRLDNSHWYVRNPNQTEAENCLGHAVVVEPLTFYANRNFANAIMRDVI